MEPKKLLEGKKVLIVDDEEDILETLKEILDTCRVFTSNSFEEARELLDKNYYDIAILDIMGVKGYELLEMANKKGIPALMLTAHALTKEDLKKSIKKEASFFAPKDEINSIEVFIADVLEAKEKNKNIWTRWYERLAKFWEKRFGPDWREDDPEFWKSLIKY